MNSENDDVRVDPTTPPVEGRSVIGNKKIPVPKKKQPRTYRVLPRDQRNGLVIINTGDGKGKTTAALGLLLRATGRKMAVGMFQFIKSIKVAECGEHLAAARLGVSIVPLGAGCTLHHTDHTDNRSRAKSGWEICKKAIQDGEFDIIILDEFISPVNRGWIDINDIISTLSSRPKGTHVVITGRAASEQLIEAADLVTEMKVIKHPLHDSGIKAQVGIDV